MNKHEYMKRRNELLQSMKAALDANDVDTANTKKAEIEALDAQFDAAAQAAADFAALQNSARAFTPVDTTPAGTAPAAVLPGAQSAATDPYDTAEYQTAFMNYVCRGTEIPQSLVPSGAMRNDAEVTTTTDAGAVVPTTLSREIIREMKAYGNIFAKVRKLNVKGGVEFPLLTLKPSAKWVSETAASDSQKVKADSKVSFSYYGIECKIAQTLLSSVVSIPEFQALFVPLAVEAITATMEKAIISGDGNGKFKGLAVDSRVPTSNAITMNSAEFSDWTTWKKKVFAKMKKAYRNGEFIMAQGTFDGYIDGMVDKNGQPIGRVNYGIADGETYRFGGKVVNTVEEDIIANFDDAAEGDVVAVFVKLSDYGVNTNMQFTTVKWTDHDTNEVKNKVMLICDGKLLDANGTLVIKKGKDTAASGT